MAIPQSFPLSRYQTVLSRDLDDARDRVAQLYCPHGLAFAGSSRSLALRHHHARLSTTSINYMDYGGDLLIEPGYLERFFLFMAPVAGSVRLNPGTNREVSAGPGGAVLASPTEYTRIRWSEDCRQIVLTLDRAAVERTLANLLQRNLRTPIVFEGAMDQADEKSAALWRAIRFVIGELDQPGSGLLDKAPASYFENMLVAMFLNGWTSNYSDALAAGENLVAPRHVRRVEAYIEANAHLPVTLENLVEAGGVSATALFEGFRRFRQTTPMAALRDYRMRRAHDDLERPAAGDSVTAIATRWGFYHLGRFAADYKKRFGVAPSEALSRALGRHSAIDEQSP
jgi:AraC-like DNA-binding protein